MQTFLTIGFLTLFSILALSVNTSLINNRDVIYASESQIIGLTYAQKLLEEISIHEFDEELIDGTVITDPADFTASNSLGMEGGESVVDDIDDYHGLSFSYDSPRIEGFQFDISVTYSHLSNPKTTSSTPTYL